MIFNRLIILCLSLAVAFDVCVGKALDSSSDISDGEEGIRFRRDTEAEDSESKHHIISQDVDKIRREFVDTETNLHNQGKGQLKEEGQFVKEAIVAESDGKEEKVKAAKEDDKQTDNEKSRTEEEKFIDTERDEIKREKQYLKDLIKFKKEKAEAAPGAAAENEGKGKQSVRHLIGSFVG